MKPLARFYETYNHRPVSYYNPLTGGMWSEISKEHRLGSDATLETAVAVCDTPVLYLLPNQANRYPARATWLQIPGVSLKKYLSKHQASEVLYQGKDINVYPIALWFDVRPGVTIKACVEAHRTLHTLVETHFQPQNVHQGNHETFPMEVLATPGQLGLDLLRRTLPYGQEYPILPDEIAAILVDEFGQGRSQFFEHGKDMIDQVYCYDGRWMYASCLRKVPTGPYIHDQVNEFMPYVSGFYLVRATVPATWSHIGLLPCRAESDKYTQGGSYHNQPGHTFLSWCTSQELSLALKYGWSVQVLERILWPETDKLPEPLKLWGERLVKLRETLVDKYPEPLRSLLRGAFRNIMLQAVGSFRRFSSEYDSYVTEVDMVPHGDVAPLLEDGHYHYTTQNDLPPKQLQTFQPQWADFIWGLARKKLAENALQLPYESLVALRTDGIWATAEHTFNDTGKVGQLRPKQLAQSTCLPWPKSLSEYLKFLVITRVY